MTTPPDFKRRTLVKALAASSLIPILGSNLIACSDGSDSSAFFNSVPADFNHGVASGDPLADRIIIWTRVTPETAGEVWVEWEMAMDTDFANIVASGSGFTAADVDFTVKADVEGLQPDSVYYYRFRTGDKTSIVGKTRTLPEGVIEAAIFAVVSCSSYPSGFFNVYREVANQEVDAVLHLGDYLYEYGADDSFSERAEEFGRVVEPTHELLSLADYRTRYAQYHRDVDLQAAHAAHPFIIVWDDHEVADESWVDGAGNHDPATEGSFAERKMAALQAWHEWLPVRPPSGMNDIIYRHFQYGDLLDLLMLDTRLVGRDQQLAYSDFATDGIIDVEKARAGFGDSNRTLLGSSQLNWLRQHLSQSTSRWQVLGQQVLLGRYHIPAPVIEALDPGIAPPDSRAAALVAVSAAIKAKNKAPEDRNEQEQALLDSALPYYLGAWDGYEFERNELLAFAQELGSKLVVLAGDTHNAWSSQLTTDAGLIAGVEFGGASVSSPGLDGFTGTGFVNNLVTTLMTTLIDDLKFANLLNRGYLHIQFTADQVVANYRFVTTATSTEYAVDEAASKSFTVNRADMLVS